MTGVHFIVLAAALFAGSGVPGLLGPSRSRWGEFVAVAMTSLAAILGLIGTCLANGEGDATLRLPWGLPWGEFAIALDPVSRAFLLPVLLVPALGAIYGLGYWPQREHPANGRRLRLFYGLMPACMILVLLAQDGILFLFGWEGMAVCGFLLVSTEDEHAAARNAAWIYLVAAHVGALTLFAMFALLRTTSGTFALSPLDGARVASIASNAFNAFNASWTPTAIFVLAAIGFGAKAGLMPLHVWLPGAHACAPSHVSAVLSGVMLNMGTYGLVRMTGLLPPPPTWWGATLLVTGAVSAVLGIAFAVGQHDLKRLLAYSSIEHMGIVTIGLGLALLGRSLDQPAWAALGLGGALLHTWNHSIFKPLMFFGAGSIVHGAATRRIDHLGGLSRTMPRTSLLFLVGAVSICALPPLNGFVSELLLFLGLFRTLDPASGVRWPAAAVAVPILGLVGGLAAVAFTKLFGIAFLGTPRTEEARRAHESPAIMLGPMAVLAAGCVVLGLFPAVLAPLMDSAVATWWPSTGAAVPSVLDLSPMRWMPWIGPALIAVAGVAFVTLRRLARPAASPRPGTWDCGHAAPSPRMQYGGASFGQSIVSLFSRALLPRVRRTRLRGLFPASARFRSDLPDLVLDRAVLPSVAGAANFLRWVRLIQQGRIQAYVLFILLTVLALLISVFVV